MRSLKGRPPMTDPCGIPGRISTPQTIAPATKIAADHQNAVV